MGRAGDEPERGTGGQLRHPDPGVKARVSVYCRTGLNGAARDLRAGGAFFIPVLFVLNYP